MDHMQQPTQVKPAVSVIIPTYNRVSMLALCIEALQRQTLNTDAFEVIVVDDGSSDGSVDLLRNQVRDAPFVLKWLQQEHAGPAAARNLGVHESRADLVAFTDDDCVADEDWLETMLESMPDDPRCAGLGGPIRRVRDSMISRYIDHANLMSHGIADDQVEYLITANALYRTDRVREVGGFNTEFSLAGGEDADLSFRIRRAGNHLLAISDKGFIRHHHHDTLRGFSRMCWRHGSGTRQLSLLGFVDQCDCTFLMVVKQNIRTLFSRSIPGSSGVAERLVWRALPLLQNLASCAGNRSLRRQAKPERPEATG
jgi:glycosyltransferase involved in cell wall biosynthesis